MLELLTRLQALTVWWAAQLHHDERGQSTVEYALVVLGAAAIALLVVAWATSTGRIGSLFDAVMRAVTDRVS